MPVRFSGPVAFVNITIFISHVGHFRKSASTSTLRAFSQTLDVLFVFRLWCHLPDRVNIYIDIDETETVKKNRHWNNAIVITVIYCQRISNSLISKRKPLEIERE